MGWQMDWARFSSEYEDLTLLPDSDRDETLAKMAERDRELSERLQRQLEREETGAFMATSVNWPTDSETGLIEHGKRIGAWRIESVLGIGGMGAVYRVTRDDGTFEQTAALKTLRRTGESLFARFENERRRLAMLEHPNIARIIDGGADDGGQPYMVVELVEGKPIDRWASGKDRPEKIRLLRQLCAALGHAHARLVLHRDIKPGNVLVNEAGDVRVIDFGIAELADDDAASAPGPLTFAVAAPEQLEGGQITTGTDIFQVGMIAHRLFAGSWPARLPSGGVQIDEAANRDPDLRAILARATALDPAERYESVDALGEDFTNFGEGSPVIARGGGPIYRAQKFVVRYSAASLAVLVALLALIGGLGASLWQADQAIKARNQAEENLRQAEWAAEISRQEGAFSRVRNDILERAFGTEENQELIQTYMRDYWEQAKKAVDEDPDWTATVANVVGNYFMFRNDYPSALEILDFAEQRQIGTSRTRWNREGMMGRIFLTTGPRDKAIHYIRKTNARYEGTYDEYSADQGATALQLARVTLDPDDIRTAIKTVDGVFAAKNHTQAPPGYFEGQVALMHRYLGDYAQSRKWFERAFSIYDASPDASLMGSDTTTMNYLGHLAFLSRDKRAAQGYLGRLAKIDAQKGPSNSRGDYFQLQAEMLLDEGLAREALQKIDKAEALFIEYAGPDSIDYWALQPLKARAMAMSGDQEGAQAIETALADAPEMVQDSRSIGLSRKLLAIELSAPRERSLKVLDGEDRRVLCMNLSDLAWYEALSGPKGVSQLPCADAVRAERKRVTRSRASS